MPILMPLPKRKPLADLAEVKALEKKADDETAM